MHLITLRESVSVTGEDGERIQVRKSNRGEPYRDGVEITIEQGYDYIGGAFLDMHEAGHIRDLMNRIAPAGRPTADPDDGVVVRALAQLQKVRTPEQMKAWINGYAVPLCQRIVDLEDPEDGLTIDPLRYTLEG